MRLGYPCINLSLGKNVSTSRTLRLATFKSKGFDYLEEIINSNIDDLFTILKWNVAHNIQVFRISNELFPHKNQYTIPNLKSFRRIQTKLKAIGNYIKDNNIRVSFHADPYCVLSSSNPKVKSTAINELNFISDIFDLMELDPSPYHKINLHIGCYNPSKEECSRRLCDAFKQLNTNTQKRITVENDDKPNGFTVTDLYNLVHKHINIPIVFDYHHHSLNTGNLSECEALQLATSTWNNIKPITHYSSSRKIYEDSTVKNVAHADYIYNKIDTYNIDIDIMLECKAKDLALIKYKTINL